MSAWIVLVEGHQRNISTILYWNRSSGLWQEYFLIFSIQINRENKPRPVTAYFWINHDGLNNLGRGSVGHQGIFLLNYIDSGFWREVFIHFFVLVALATRILHGLPKLWITFQSVSPKDHSCGNCLKLAQWFRCPSKTLWTGRRVTTTTDGVRSQWLPLSLWLRLAKNWYHWQVYNKRTITVTWANRFAYLLLKSHPRFIL